MFLIKLGTLPQVAAAQDYLLQQQFLPLQYHNYGKKKFYRSGNKFLIAGLANQDNDKKGLHNP